MRIFEGQLGVLWIRVLNGQGISADPKKVGAILNIQPPSNAIEVRSLLGMSNYCSRFIKGYATVTQPLRELTHKDTSWQWTTRHNHSLNQLKEALTNAPVTSYFDPDRDTEINVDASPVGLGAILAQTDPVTGEKKVVAYASRALTDVENRLWLHFNDPKSKPPARIERWTLRLQPYQVTIVVTILPTSCSDTPIEKDTSVTNRQQKIAEEFVDYIVHTSTPKSFKLQDIASATEQDPTLQAVMKAVRSVNCHEPSTHPGVNTSTYKAIERVKDELTICSSSNVLLRSRGTRIVIPETLQLRVVNLTHEGHQGIVKTKSLLREKVWFAGIDPLVEETVKSCLACQAATPETKREPLKMSALPKAPWQDLSGSQYEGLMQDIYLYSISLTNREVIEAFSGVLPQAYIATQCRCPPGYPKIMETTRAKCTKNGEFSAGQSTSRLADTAHPIELATDGDTTTYWQSKLTNTASLYLDLMYGEMQIFYIILEFYGPQPSAIKIERSRDHGLTFKPWQYFAEDCIKSFTLANNGPLPQPDSINCIQYELPLKSSEASVSFKTEQPPPDGSSIPVRPFGSPCTKLYCSDKLLEFLKASHVKFSFFNHTLSKNEKHKYFALNRIVVAGRTTRHRVFQLANVNANNLLMDDSAIIVNKATLILNQVTLQCDCKSNVTGLKCDTCLPGSYGLSALEPTGCKACGCDPFGSLNALCDGTSGQCRCKAGSTGRRCDQCDDGYHSLDANGCKTCNCSEAGSKPSLVNKCNKANGQCYCKTYTAGTRCDRCQSGYFNMSSSNPDGCIILPSQQAPPFVRVISSRILGVTWNEPDNPNGIIDRYELYRNGSLIYKGLKRAFNDTGLTPNSYYYYYLLTYTEKGDTTRSYQDNRVYKTPEDAPQQISPPTITDVKARTAKATWTKPLITNGLVVEYRLVSVNSRSSSEVQHCRGLIFACDVSDLKPFTTYNFTVVVCNSGGCGRSDPKNVKTRQAAPDSQPMPDITLILGGESVIVTWNEPAVPNGKVFRYDMYMRAHPFSGSGNAITPSSPVDVRNMTVTKLVPYTLYEFRVVSYTAEVNGDTSSAWKRVRTAEGVPTGESAIQPRATAVSSDSIKVTWSPPSSPKGIIVRYIVKIYNQPPRELQANGTDRSLVVTGLKPYTTYKFTVISCNSYQCTGESASTTDTTLPAVPEGQGSPRVTKVDSHSVSMAWTHPETPNGPLPPSYNVTRASAAFNDPPQEVTAGVHFPGLGYYKFPADFVLPGARNDIEFSFRTQHPNGLIMLLVSDGSQEDLLAVELRKGKPWFIFDCQTGPAAFTITENMRFDDSKWHHVKLARSDRVGTITIDGRYSRGGTSASGSSTIGGYTAVYVGGLPNDFKIKRSDSGNAVLKRLHFIGCLKNFKSDNKDFDWKKELEKVSVEPETKDNETDKYSGTELYLLVTGLEPYTRYQYRISTSTAKGTGYGNWTYAVTYEDDPENIKPPQVTALSSSSLLVKWTRPGIPNGYVINYIVRVLETGANFSMNSSSVFQYTVTGLKPYIMYSNGNLLANASSSTSQVTLTNLLPYTVYNIRVEVCTVYTCTKSPVASKRTRPAAPDGLAPPRLTPGPNFMVINWDPPSRPNGIMGGYKLFRPTTCEFLPVKRVVAVTMVVPWSAMVTLVAVTDLISSMAPRNGTLVYNGTDVCSKTAQGQVKCIYKDTGLSPMTSYSYSVAAKTTGGTTRSDSSSAQTPESSPEGVPLPRLTPRSAYEIYAEWDPPLTPNGVIIRYGIIVDGKEYNTTLNKHKVIGGLKPYTKYAFRVKACTSKGCGIGNRAYARTSEAPPSGVNPPRLEAKEWNVVYVSWDEPTAPNGIVTEYRVERRLGNQVPIIVCLTTGSTLPRRNCLDSSNSLKGYTVYEYRIRAKNGGGIGTGSWKSVRTLEGPPRGIKQPTVFVINATAVIAKWEAPLEPNGVITHYELRFQPLNVVDGNITVAGRVDSKTFRMTVNILKANTDYQFLITAINKRREGSSSWTSAKTKEAPPTDLKPLNAERLSGGTSLRLFWDQPGSPNGLISKYNIYKDDVKIYEGKTRIYVVTKLIPYTAYEFQLEACTSAGCAKGNKQTIYSAEINPSGQAPPTSGFVNDTVVVVNWRYPVVPNGVIERFDVVRSSSSLQVRRRRSVSEDIIYSTNNTNATQFTYMDTVLTPYTRYKYKIRAVNKGGQTDSDWLIVDTKQAPPRVVDSPAVTSLDAYRLNVTWSKPAQPNGIIQYYLVHRNGTISYQGNDLYFVDIGRDPYTVYSYTITVCSGGGCTMSKHTSQRTDEAAPAQVSPPTLEALSAIAIRITWSLPIKPNGIITGYKLYESTTLNLLYSGKDQRFTVSARKPYTKYTFHIEACTRAGCTKSSTATVRTLESAPGSMDAPVATVAGSRHVRVEWKPPAQPNGIMLYYILTRDGSAIYNGSDIRYDDYNIAPYTVYKYTVTAYNKAGRGVESPVGRNSPTYPGAPDNITAPVLTVLSATSMRVSWTEPGRPNGVISKYYVLYNNKEKDALLAKEAVLDGLQPYTVYTVRIKACTTSVACSVGEHTQARTHEAAPVSQGYPVIPSESITARSVLVTWNEPQKPNGLIIKYTLQRRQVYRPIGGQMSYSPVTFIYNATNATALAFTDRTVEPYSEYQYRVTSTNSVGSTTSGWAVVKTLTDVPENIPKPQIIKTHQDRIEVLIKAPSKPNGEIRNYIIKVSGKNTSTGLEMSRVVANLESYSTYRISVYACTDAGCIVSPEAVARTTEGTPTKFSAPRIIKLMSRSVELAWDEPAKPSGILRRYEVLHRVSCATSCELPDNSTNVGLEKNATVKDLQPYITYDFIIRAYNDKYSGLSDGKAAKTLPEDPVTRPDSPPRVNVTGYHVLVDWSNCFILNGPLDGYTLLERGVIVFLGEKTSAALPNRERGEYTYEVLVTTIVNGQKKTARSLKVNVVVPNEGIVEPVPTAQPLSVPFYQRAVVTALSTLGNENPSPHEQKCVQDLHPCRVCTLVTGREEDLNTFNTGSTVALFDHGGRLTPKADPYDSIDRYERYNRYNKSLDLTNGSVHKFGLDESSDWNDPPQTYSNKDSGLLILAHRYTKGHVVEVLSIVLSQERGHYPSGFWSRDINVKNQSTVIR
ncbi:hypothetical protein QZH41_003681 [Actinostola sp. cb2023]|nr:hypothetical protein QZH41_003681 [Actinostola sp. cb2023]